MICTGSFTVNYVIFFSIQPTSKTNSKNDHEVTEVQHFIANLRVVLQKQGVYHLEITAFSSRKFG